MKKANYITLLFGLLFSTLNGQVTNIRVEHDAKNEQYLIRYDLAKNNQQRYFDIELTATIGGVKVRPSLAALSGDVGLNIRYGSNQQIRWNYFIDIEKIIGEVQFKVRARPTFLPPPPQPHLDLALGATVSGVGLVVAALGGRTVLKKGKRDVNATATDDPILFYYTFCDESSPNRDPSLLEISPDNPVSACDNHLSSANRSYQKGITQSALGIAMLAGGLYLLIKKPLVQKKVKAYRKKYDLTLQPTFNWSAQAATSVVGLQLRCEFGGRP
ncbi:MAG: hypothetical protein AAGJ18_12355 [Bacteroidota bacterium]